MSGVAILSGAAVGLGATILLAARWARPSLAERIADPEPPPPTPDQAGWSRRLGQIGVPALRALGLPTVKTVAELRACDRHSDDYLAEKAAMVLAAIAVPTVAGIALSASGTTLGTTGWLLWGLALVVAWVAPDIALRRQAASRREEMRAAVGVYTDLVVLALAGGAGVTSALRAAGESSDHWAMRRIHTTTHHGALRGAEAWDTLRGLGDHYQVTELHELAASLQLAGADGARVRTSLAAKAAAMRTHHMNTLEAHAESATERLSLPVVGLCAGYLILLTYPAISQITTLSHP